MIQTLDGLDLWYEKTGNGPPILLLHGNGESHKIFDILTARLSETYTVYALDSRDHGQSSKTQALGYKLMTSDVVGFIDALKLEKPILLGFSDGGIIGLMLASSYPGLLSKLIICGASTHPGATKARWLFLFRLIHFFTRDRKFRLMLTEPNMTKDDLSRIDVPVLVLAGEHDMIREEDTLFIAGSIKGSLLRILPKEGHMSYVIHSPKLHGIIRDFLGS
jgi:pimeloyl-ACP methyl ester carboxylesterase